MKILFIGGTGIISTASTALAAKLGLDITLLSRGQHAAELPAGVKTLITDVNDPALVQKLEHESFDAVVDWIAFTPADIERDLNEGFPVTIVRPSLTYGETLIPLVLNSWQQSYTAVDRMIRGQKMVVPGDGSSLWVITHNTDFAKGLVGLLGHPQAIGHAFHITSDEVLTWDQLFRIVGAAVGVEPQLVHIPSDFIAACLPDKKGTLIGDKSVSVVFDNSKIKRFVPGYCATTSFAEGIRQSLAWFNADPSRKQIDQQVNATMDKLISAYEKGMSEAVRGFASRI